MKRPALNYRVQILKKPRIFFSTLYLIITLVLIIIFLSYYNYEKAKIKNDRFSYLSSVAKFKLSQLNNWLDGRYSQLEVLKANEPLINELRSINVSSKVIPGLEKWFDALKSYYGYDEINLVRNSRQIVYSTTGKNTKLNSKDSILCTNAILADVIIFSDSDENNSFPDELKFYLPLNNLTGNSSTLLLSTKTSESFNSLLNNDIDMTSTLEGILVKPYKDGIIYLNKLKSSTNSNDTSSAAINKAISEARLIDPKKGFIEGIDYKNERVIALMQRIPNTCWTLITKIDKSEFYRPVDNLFKFVLLGFLSGNLLLVVILILIWRKTIISNYRKITETEIEKSKVENRFESLVNGVKDLAIFILDREGNIISWNEGAQIIEGYSSNEIIGKNISVFYTKEEIKNNKPKENLGYAKKDGSYQQETWRVKKDGSPFWANILITSLKDDNGNIYGYLKVIRDLTEKRKSEDEIKKSRDFYLKLLDDFPNPVWRSGINGKYDYFNKAWLNYTGRKLEEELAIGWETNLHPNDKDKVIRNFNELFQQRKYIIQEYRLKNSTGEYRWLINFGMPYSDVENNFAGYLGSCYDIHERKKYEETIDVMMRVSEQLYSSLDINQILDLLVTESIQLTKASSGFACIKAEEVFCIRRIFNVDHWEYFDKQYAGNEYIIKILEKSRKAMLVKDFTDQNNEELIKKFNVRQLIRTPLFGANGEIIGFFELHYNNVEKEIQEDEINLINSIAKNASIAIIKSLNYEQLRITESQLRNSESELRNLTAQIQYARETERRDIAREIHDELGQLFTGINLNISFLKEQLEQNQKLTLDEIIAELASVQQIVKKGIQTVRDLSGSLRSYVLDHLGFISAVQEYCREIERISNIKCAFQSNLDSFDLSEEKNVALFRIIQEALTNVLRHADATLISITINKNEKNLEMVVADNGKGLESSTPSVKSMGILGMKERAIFLKGKLKIESEKDRGTKVLLSVPIE